MAAEGRASAAQKWKRAWVSQTHMEFWVVNTAERFRGRLRGLQSSIEGFPGPWNPSEVWGCAGSCLNLSSTLWMPCAKYLGESREMPVEWGRGRWW